MCVCVCVYIYIYIYVQLHHFAVQRKLTYHCKSTIPQQQKIYWMTERRQRIKSEILVSVKASSSMFPLYEIKRTACQTSLTRRMCYNRELSSSLNFIICLEIESITFGWLPWKYTWDGGCWGADCLCIYIHIHCIWRPKWIRGRRKGRLWSFLWNRLNFKIKCWQRYWI